MRGPTHHIVCGAQIQPGDLRSHAATADLDVHTHPCNESMPLTNTRVSDDTGLEPYIGAAPPPLRYDETGTFTARAGEHCTRSGRRNIRSGKPENDKIHPAEEDCGRVNCRLTRGGNQCAFSQVSPHFCGGQ